MFTYGNGSIEKYTNEMPSELRRAMKAMGGDIGLAVFLVLFKYGELSFSQIMTELEIPQEYSSQLTYHIKKLQKAGLVKNEYIKKENTDSYSFYDITEFGEDFVTNLMNTIKVPRPEHVSSDIKVNTIVVAGVTANNYQYRGRGRALSCKEGFLKRYIRSAEV